MARAELCALPEQRQINDTMGTRRDRRSEARSERWSLESPRYLSPMTTLPKPLDDYSVCVRSPKKSTPSLTNHRCHSETNSLKRVCDPSMHKNEWESMTMVTSFESSLP